VKSTLSLTTYPGIVFTSEFLLNALALSQTTGVNKITKRKFLGFQAIVL